MTLLIRNVRLVDGIHDFPERADVFVANGKISAIGNFGVKQAAGVLDGHGAYLAPGFIDVNTDSDHYLTLFAYPAQADFLAQGVTTIFGGMCGSSLAPLIYGTLEALEAWSNAAKINVGWHTVAEFLEALDRTKLGVNFGTLAGHATARRAIAGDDARELTKNEKNVLEKVLRQALDEGAFGVSTGSGYGHGKDISAGELKWLAQIVQSVGGVHAMHLRDAIAGVENSVRDAIRLAESSGVKSLVSHFVPFRESGAAYERALSAIDVLPFADDFRFDLYPSDRTMLSFGAFLPRWAQADAATMAKNAGDAWLAPRILKDMAPFDAGSCTVLRAPGQEFLVGKTLAELTAMYDVRDPREAFLRLGAATGMHGTLLCHDLDGALIRRALTSPRSFIASNAPGFGPAAPGTTVRSERTTSTFPKFLSLVENENLLPVKDAVRKLSYEPAQFFGLKDRGELREGAAADMTCFKDGEIKFTIVGGQVAWKDGEFKDVFNGKALRKEIRRY